MGAKAWQRRLLILVFWWRLTYAVFVPFRVPLCPKVSVPDAIFDFRDSYCPITSAHTESIEFVGVTEGDEVSLQKALNMIYKNSNQYVAVLFYASWCPFSRSFRPSFNILSSSYPSIPHFAIDEAAVRPSILSKYGVHGFPTLFLLNSTMRARYHGNRSLKSVSAFYGDVTGIKNCLDQISLGRISRMSNHEKHNSTEQESCPFPWARSPENLLRQETYLALATTFVLLRLLYLLYPTMLVIAQLIWTLLIQNVKLGALLEHPLAYLKRAIQLFNSLKEPCKRSNLQGAMNARAWASKSLATVSIGDANTSRAVPITGCH
ncbi:5'-adenylylsulfate reductase-like 4 [Hibiscus syriacus]|uniref:5'-adenylylsulfate reductase-like 4 n=1 Tax=Hibiscus syriacus TaxID=106335 RepID=A0A6A2ZFG8_HIBSY|nr:5'-adenylylsulfate reductase-like 4 isoform X1 [Hibiscus syriacus]KAE8690407.1 5'-adenylylsulfate reductase-like 4 [Hibiscus syriacus]